MRMILLLCFFTDFSKALNCIKHPHCKKCGVTFDTAVSANHTFIIVISTSIVPYNTPLVWHVHFIFSVHCYVFAKLSACEYFSNTVVNYLLV